MELLMILAPCIIISIMMIIFYIKKGGGGCFKYVFLEVNVIILIISAIINLLIGGCYIIPDYEESIKEVIPLNEVFYNGSVQKDKYYIIEPKETDIVINKGNTQETYYFNKIVYDNKKEIIIYEYKHDDSKFPYCLFFTDGKENIKELHVPKDSGIINQE